MKAMTFLIENDLHKEFKKFCTDKGLPMGTVLALAIKYILKKKDIPKN